MHIFIARRLVYSVFVLIAVSILVFSLQMTFSPERLAMRFIESPKQAEDMPEIIISYGFDQPYYIQYGRWVKRLLTGDWGTTRFSGRSIMETFRHYFPMTLELNLYAIPCVLWFGIWIGTKSGASPGKSFDHTSRIFTVVGYSLPLFLFGLILIMFFYGHLGILPPGVLSDETSLLVFGRDTAFIRYTGLITIDGLLNKRLDVTLEAFQYLLLPVFTLTIVSCAVFARIIRSGIIDEMSKAYVDTAKAKGADKQTVIIRHARRNALLPVVTISGQMIAGAMDGSIVVEVIFNRIGLGSWAADAAAKIDVPAIMFLSLFTGLCFVIVTLVIDIMYAFIDPRIRIT